MNAPEATVRQTPAWKGRAGAGLPRGRGGTGTQGVRVHQESHGVLGKMELLGTYDRIRLVLGDPEEGLRKQEPGMDWVPSGSEGKLGVR